jgi:hypothetical protein
MNRNFIKIALIMIGILLALGAWFLWRNVYSRDVLKLEILAVSEADAGTRIDYTVRYKNNGNVRLENARMVFEFPENTVIADELRNLDDERITLRGSNRVEIVLGELYPGEEKTEELKGYVFGKENSTVTAKVTVYFKPKNLNIEYTAETTHTLLVTGVPINFDLHMPSSVDAEKEFNFDVNYFSKIDYPISNLRIKIDYPSEFVFKESRPRPSFDKSEWEIGVLNRGEGGRLEISGILEGEPSQIKVFKASLGFWQDGRFVLLKEATRGMEIATPLLYITHRINEKPQYAANVGEYLYYEIFFRNTGDEPLEKLFLTIKLGGGMIDFDRVQLDSGVFQKSTGTIIWDSKETSELELLPPMQEGKVSFWAKVKDNVTGTNPEIEVDISLNQVKKRIITKVNTKMVFTQQVFSSKGPFNNYGPQPPQVGSSTSYTVRWHIRNTNNEVKDLKVRAKLPLEVRLSGETYPEDTRITFDPMSREVVWDVGNILPNSEKETYFQIIFDPSSQQKNELAELITEAVVSGKDNWTGSTITATSPLKKTNLPDDASITDEMGIVR